MNQLHQAVNIMSWNACSLTPDKRSILEEYIEKNKYNIIFISESKLQTVPSGFKNFLKFKTQDTILLVRKNVKFTIKLTIDNSSCEGFLIDLGNKKLLFGYCRNGNEDIGIKQILSAAHDNRVDAILGDLNVNFRNNNYAARTLGSWLETHRNMFDMNTNGVHTFQRKDIRSIIDYCYASNKIVKQCSFRVDPLSLSDHYPLCLRIGRSGMNFHKFDEITPSAIFQLRLHKKTIDEIWLKKFLDRWIDPPEVDDDGSAFLQHFYSVVASTFSAEIARVNSSVTRPYRYWIDQEVHDLIKERKSLTRQKRESVVGDSSHFL